MVCLVLNGREMVHQLVSQLKMVVYECKWTFQEGDFKKWELVVQEIVRILKVNTTYIWEYQNNFYNFIYAFKILIFKTQFFSNNFQNFNFPNLIFKTSNFK